MILVGVAILPSHVPATVEALQPMMMPLMPSLHAMENDNLRCGNFLHRLLEVIHSATGGSTSDQAGILRSRSGDCVLLAWLMANERVAHELMILLYFWTFSAGSAVWVALTA